MVDKGGRVLLAVSGGADSTVMVDSLSQLSESLYVDFYVCHVNHGLRGDEANRDEEFVIELCERYNLPLTVRRFDPDEVERVRQGNVEEEARNLRYTKLAHTAQELGCERIATAHTLSDQAETVLHRMIRACGLSGLCGIWPIQADWDAAIIRPLIEIRREEVLRYAQERSLSFRNDSMNDDPAFTRVRIRQTLLPALAEFNPNVAEALSQLAAAAQSEERFWWERIDELKRKIGSAQENDPADRALLLELSEAEQRRLLRIYAIENGLEPSFSHIEAAIEMLYSAKAQSELHLSSQTHLYRRYNRIFFAPPLPAVSPLDEMILNVPGETAIDAIGVEILAEIHPAKVRHILASGARVAQFDAAKIRQPITARSRREGDFIQPLGMIGAKKVKKILQEHRAPLEERDRIPIICFGGEIAWVVGCAQSDLFKIDDATETILRLTVRPME